MLVWRQAASSESLVDFPSALCSANGSSRHVSIIYLLRGALFSIVQCVRSSSFPVATLTAALP